MMCSIIMESKFKVKCSLLLTIILLLIAVAHMQVSSGCLEDERLGLLHIKAFFLSHKVNQFPIDVFPSWVGANCCNWDGVHCNNLTSGVHVVELFLHDLLEFDISELLDDNFTNLSYNYSLNVSIFQNFKELKTLDLSYNGFSGFSENQGFNKFPSFNKLETLNLKGNPFGNQIFSSLSGLMSLKNLSLRLGGLEGSITLFGLENLRKLDLSANKLNGALQIEGLERLEILDMGSNKLNNSIFQSIRGLISLKTLILSRNNFGGIIPTQDIAKLESLEILDLSHNNYYDGAIPLKDLKNLRALDLTSNQLNGSLPIQEFCETSSLIELAIGHNQIRDQLPHCIGNLSRFRYFDISYNQFNGKIPATIHNLTSIVVLSLLGNDFEGQFLLSTLANLTNLKVFELSKVQVDTEKSYWIPMFQLDILTLYNCELNKQTTSNIPSFLFSQHSLRSVDLSHNQLLGTFPVWLLQNNSELLFLDLSSNSLSGILQLPTWKQKLKYLLISDNNFSGRLSSNVGLVLARVLNFNISSNGFEGNLPLSMEQMKDLYYLDLSNNKFSGNLQTSIFNNMSYLRYLLLASNNFSGSIEYEWNNNTDLVAMDISNNMISGKLPNWIGRLRNLKYVRISNNKFEGELPIGLCSPHQLILLDVSQNKLFGVPSCLNSSSLVYLYMRENLFSGLIPHAFSNGSKLKVLDLSYNNFAGPIPSWIYKLTSLRVLLLKMNQLQDSIPQQLCQVGALSIVDFSNNKLIGSIPSCLDNMTFGVIKGDEYSTIPQVKYYVSFGEFNLYHTYFESINSFFPMKLAMVIITEQIEVDFTTKSRLDSYKGNILELMFGLDLSHNQLTGNIPPQIGDLLQIHALNFSHNKLVGHIPKEISNLKQLESLDLSNNFLSGNIPSELGGLNSLGTFNVSYNNLSGMIPTSPHFLTYPESSYYGNSFLCGLYIEQKCPSSILPRDNRSIKLGEEEDGAFIDLEAFYWSSASSYITIMFGFAVVLYINPQWRETWFYFIEDCCSYFCKYCI